ncbi:CDP-archaeol synthase [Edaphobacter paludis]|uniref:CDP-archaeol synthase n=1 Tax=Edaphobacter paludis TaxID=3035702 RepID=A0AAU7D7U3_9BACT
MHPKLIIQLLALLGLANGMPVIMNKLMGKRWSYPMDGGARFVDGQPLFGASKTVRGTLVAVLATAAGAPLVGLTWKIGVAAGTAAMAGDLFSSFLKRRMRLHVGDRATGLDQIPESLFPLLACHLRLPLTALDIAAVIVAFLLGEVLLSLLFYRLHLRERPY